MVTNIQKMYDNASSKDHITVNDVYSQGHFTYNDAFLELVNRSLMLIRSSKCSIVTYNGNQKT